MINSPNLSGDPEGVRSSADSSSTYIRPPFLYSGFGQAYHAPVKKKIIDDSYLQLSGVAIGVTTFDGVIDIFGKSKLYWLYEVSSNYPKVDYSPKVLCYKSESDNTSVAFLSDSSGGWETITKFWIGNINLIDSDKCAISKLLGSERMTVNDLALGITESDVENIIGHSSTYTIGSSMYVTDRNWSMYFVAYENYWYIDETTLYDGRQADVVSGFEFGYEPYVESQVLHRDVIGRLYWFSVFKKVLD